MLFFPVTFIGSHKVKLLLYKYWLKRYVCFSKLGFLKNKSVGITNTQCIGILTFSIEFLRLKIISNCCSNHHAK